MAETRSRHQSLFRETQALEKSLADLRKVKKPSVLFDNNFQDIRRRIIENYVKLILSAYEFVATNGCELSLWQYGFYFTIETCRSSLRKSDDAIIREHLQTLLLEAAGLYRSLLAFLKSGKERLGDSNNELQHHYTASCYRCLVFLGDIARYSGNEKEARSFYFDAVSTMPHDGRAWNQLGVLRGPASPLETLYYLHRAVCARQPFSRAKGNLNTYRAASLSELTPLDARLLPWIQDPYQKSGTLLREHQLAQAIVHELDQGGNAMHHVAMCAVSMVADVQHNDWFTVQQFGNELVSALAQAAQAQPYEWDEGRLWLAFACLIVTESLVSAKQLNAAHAIISPHYTAFVIDNDVEEAMSVARQAWSCIIRKQSPLKRLPATHLDYTMAGFLPLKNAHDTMAWGRPADDPDKVRILLLSRFLASQDSGQESTLTSEATAARRNETMQVMARQWLQSEVQHLESSVQNQRRSGAINASVLFVIPDAECFLRQLRQIKEIVSLKRYVVVACRAVIDRLDMTKKGPGESSQRAREVTRYLDQCLSKGDPFIKIHETIGGDNDSDGTAAVRNACLNLAQVHGPSALLLLSTQPEQFVDFALEHGISIASPGQFIKHARQPQPLRR